MAVDKANNQADSGAVRAAEAIRVALGDRKQAWLSAETGIDEPTLSRLLGGKGNTRLIDRFAAIEEALGLQRGALLREAGYVDEVVSVEDAIRADVHLDPDDRETLLRITSGFPRRATRTPSRPRGSKK